MDTIRKVVAGLVAITACLIYVHAAHAAAPQQKGQAPGYYRMLLGDFEIVALSDGTVALDVRKPTLGNLGNNLKAAGYQPDQVDEIYITHMHADHVGGLMAGDQRVFPNATVRADKRDADYWLSQANLDAAPEGAKGFFKGAMASLNPYLAAGKFQPFDGSGELTPGIKAVSTYGHTKGHTMYLVESKGQRLAVLGDLMHVAAVQFVNPAVTIEFDTDPKLAAVQRKKVYADGAKQRFWLAVAHLPFPGIGHLRADGRGYVYVPANYSVPR